MLTSIFGIILTAIGMAMIIRTSWFVENFGYIAWAEEKMGAGGTYSFYKIAGVVCIFLGLIFLFHLHGQLAYFLLGPVLPKKQ